MAEVILDEDTWKTLALNKATEHGFVTEDLHASKVAGYHISLNLENFKNSLMLNAVGIRERFVSTAVKEDSIIKAASDRNIDIQRAIPAYAKVLVVLNIGDMIQYINDEGLIGENRKIILKKESPIMIDKTPFSLYYDVEISFVNGDTPIIKYTNSGDGYINPLDTSGIIDKPISTVNTTVGETGDSKAIGIILDVRQYVRQLAQVRYVQNIKVEIHNISYTNQLADFSVRYAPNDYIADSGKRYLSKKSSFAKEDVVEEAIFYRYPAANTIQLFNRMNGNFVPDTNSLLDIEIMSTLGIGGNFNYTGSNITIPLPSGLIENTIIIISQPSAGKNTPTIEEMRSKVIQMSATRGTISNEEDLKKVYADNLGVYKIEKLRHDFFSLTYGVVSALKNEDYNFYYPTNTLDLLFYPAERDYLTDSHIVVDPNIIISYEHGLATNRDLTEVDVTRYDYTIPYIMIYNVKTNTVSVYERMVDREYIVDKKETRNDLDFTMIMNKFKLSKTSLSNPVIQAYITTTRDIANDGNTIDDKPPVLGLSDNYGEFVDDGTVIIRVVFKNQGLFVGYKDMKIESFNNDDKYYSVKLEEFIDTYPYDGKVLLHLKDMNGEDMDILTPISNIFIEFEVYLYQEGLDVSYGYPDLNSYIRMNIYTSDELVLYKNISHINNIQATAKNGTYLFKRIPMISHDAYLKYPSIIDERIKYELDKLENIYNLTPQNHQISLSFANTYGFSKRYKVGHELNLDLDQLYISMKLTIKLKKGGKLDKLEVIRFINDRVMLVDFKNGDYLHVGNIIVDLKNKYPQIGFIEFGGINNLPSVYQYIGLDTTDTIVDSIPEIISIEHLYDDEYGFVPNIVIDILE